MEMEQISRDDSERLRKLTRGRNAIEIDFGGGFIIGDDANGREIVMMYQTSAIHS
jgi:exonuclease SbcC